VSQFHYTVLAGGTGAAKFLRGMVQVVPPEDIHVIVNVGDDLDIWGLHISPDIDSIAYGLAGKLDAVRGWGLAGEAFRCLEEMEAYGMPAWFRLGDRDLATHITRTELLRSGLTLSQTVERMTKALGVQIKRTGVISRGNQSPGRGWSVRGLKRPSVSLLFKPHALTLRRFNAFMRPQKHPGFVRQTDRRE